MSKIIRFRSSIPTCDECGEIHDIEDMTEHYCSGANHIGYNKDIGLFCTTCFREIELNDTIELRKANENIRVRQG